MVKLHAIDVDCRRTKSAVSEGRRWLSKERNLVAQHGYSVVYAADAQAAVTVAGYINALQRPVIVDRRLNTSKNAKMINAFINEMYMLSATMADFSVVVIAPADVCRELKSRCSSINRASSALMALT